MSEPTWTRAADVAEVTPGKATIVTIRGKEIGLFHEGGRYHAVLNFCPHYGAPVCMGRVTGAVTACGPTDARAPTQLGYNAERRVLRCPWHHWEFDLADGRALAPIKQRLKLYPVREEDGVLFVAV